MSFHRRLALSSCPVVGAGQTIHESNRNVKHIFEEIFSRTGNRRHKPLIFVGVAEKNIFCIFFSNITRIGVRVQNCKTPASPHRAWDTGFNLQIIRLLENSKQLPDFFEAKHGHHLTPQHHTHSRKATPPGGSETFTPNSFSISESSSIGASSGFNRFSKLYMPGFLAAQS